MFSFTRLRGADPTLGCEMSSTGEVACFGADVHEAFLQALLATNFQLPQKTADKFILISIAEDSMRLEFFESVKLLFQMGYQLAGTPGTAAYYSEQGIPMRQLDKPSDESVEQLPKDGVLAWIRDKRVDLCINIPEGTSRTEEITGGYLMRRAAVDFGCSLLTNIKIAILFVSALHRNLKLPCKAAEEWLAPA